MLFSFGRKKTWVVTDKGAIYCRFWGISAGDWHIGIQRWWTESASVGSNVPERGCHTCRFNDDDDCTADPTKGFCAEPTFQQRERKGQANA